MDNRKGIQLVVGLVVAAALVLPTGSAGAAANAGREAGGSIVYNRYQGVIGGGVGSFQPEPRWVGIPSQDADLDVFLRTMDSDEESPVAETEFVEDAPRWAPDGRSVAYSSNETGSFQIYVSAPGGKPRQITSGSRNYALPSWSPDGRDMVVSGCTDGRCRIYRMRADGSHPVAISSGPDDYFPEWSPDGKWVVFTGRDTEEPGGAFHLWLVRPDGSFIKRITAGNIEGFSPRWSPDGKRIAFSAAGRVNEQGFAASHIYVMDRDGSHRRRLTVDEHVDDIYPCWSPDGSRIAFGRQKMVYRPEDPLGLYTYIHASADLYAVTMDGEIEQLTDTPHISEALCDWS